MATAFSIQAPTNALALDDQGRAVIVFTVGNLTNRSLRARASVSPFEGTPADWFKIDGEAERLLPFGVSEAYTVRIAAPQDAAKRRYAFRLDVVSVEHPDEEWEHGTTVGFEVAGEPQPPRDRGYLETVVGAVVGGLAGILVGVVTGLLVWLPSGLPLSTLVLFFGPILGGALVAGVALGGAIGVFGALTLRPILLPKPWHTALAYLVAAILLTLILEVVVEIAMPNRLAVGRSDPAGAPNAVLVRLDPTVTYPFEILKYLPTGTIIGTQPTVPTVPTPVVVVAPPRAPAVLVVGVPLLLALISAVLAALAARAATRWQLLRTL